MSDSATLSSNPSAARRGRRSLRERLERLPLHLWTRIYCALKGIPVGRGTTVSPFAALERSSGGTIRLGKACRIHRGALLLPHGGSIVVGSHTSINPYAVVYGQGGVTIGEGVRIAAHAVIIPANHGFAPDEMIHRQPETRKGIVIEDDVWIGTGARILDGVTVAHGSIVAAGAVLTRSTEAFGIYGGVPARKIGDRRAPRNAKAADADLQPG
jgi:acetyltransferase-like isoleucine patch superfamily enzyme